MRDQMTGGSWRHASVLVAIPAVLIALAVFATANIERSSALDAATAQQQGQALLTAMLDQETGARGYFQTRDLTFLQPWFKGTRGFSETLADARATDSGDHTLERSLRTQAGIAADWHASAAAAIAGLRYSDVHPTIAEALNRKSAFDAFRASNAAFMQQLADSRNSSLSTATAISVLVVVLLAVAMTFSAIMLVRRRSRRDLARRLEEDELRELLQVSESEGESRQLVIRHIERIIPGARAAVLNRNNSDDRLEPSLGARASETLLRDLPLEQLAPRSCLAVRLTRPYGRSAGEHSLAECEVCGRLEANVACEPLLVGGKVIGSVLVADTAPLSVDALGRVRDTVVAAAPIIANQRNLSLAETRAASDQLTGLPNRRAADDTLKRMAAHAGRTASPMSAVLIDLDHFKQVNDLHGHDQGDQVLAAVGQVLGSALRASDFAARFGGEEFLLLLPDTGGEQAQLVAEKVRIAIAALEGTFGTVTASFGVATFPDDASDTDTLLRKADRALYVAKHSGRNRVAVATGVPGPETDQPQPG